MDFMVLFCSLSLLWMQAISSPINNGYPSFSTSNLLLEKLNNQDFRERNETEESLKSLPSKLRQCVTRAECIPLNYSTCFGIRVPYTRTSLSLVANISSQEQVQGRLDKFRKSLIHIPKCWAVVQPFLCALFMPKCEEGQVVLPSKEMCEKIQYSCRILNTGNLWPAEFDCTPFKQEKCKNDLSELKFNTTSQCLSPLIRTERESLYYDGIEGCGFQFHDPFFSDEERSKIAYFEFLGSVVAFSINLFAVLTLLLDWRSTIEFPTALAVLFSNVSFLIVSCGYMYQLKFGANDSMSHKDGTPGTSELGLGRNLSSVIRFFIVYYADIAGIVWFAVVAYAWNSFVKHIVKGRPLGKKDEMVPYYHIAAWSLPFVLTVTIMAMGEIDEDSLLRVSYVGGINEVYRLFFLFLPLLFSIFGWFLFIRAAAILFRFMKTHEQQITPQRNKIIWINIFRVSLLSILILIFGIMIFFFHLDGYFHHDKWETSLRKFITCQLSIAADLERCRMQHRPNLSITWLRIIAQFGTHISMALWILEKSTVKNWHKSIKKVIFKLLNIEVEESIKIFKHKLIARAFAKKNQLRDGGKLSIDMRNHQDPVGLNFELNNSGSRYSNSLLARVIPRFVERRGALVVVSLSRSNSSKFGNSVESERSVSVLRFSIEPQSRRNSADSTTSARATEVRNKIKKKNSRRSRNRLEKLGCKSKIIGTEISSIRSSNSSLAKNLEKEVMGVFISNERTSFAPNMNRRFAIAEIDNSTLNLLDIEQQLQSRCEPNDDNDNARSNNSLDIGHESENYSDNELC